MKVYYIGQAYQPVSTAGSKPMQDFDHILRKKGFKNIGLPSITIKYAKLWWIYNWISAKIGKLRMPKDVVVIFQYPEQRHLFETFNKACSNRNKTVILIHDIPKLRTKDSTNDDCILSKGDVLIAHTENMASWIKENFERKGIVILNIFDYLSDFKDSNDDIVFAKPYSIVFAGNLNKAEFIKKLQWNPNLVRLNLFGPNLDDRVKQQPFVDYKGVVPQDRILQEIYKYDFGLVWDGEDIATCSGDFGNYLRFNAPYKLSSYLAAGLPVIVWERMALSSFIKDKKIGISVDSIQNLDKLLENLTESDYRDLKNNVETVRKEICSGYFYSEALLKSEKLL